MKALRTTVLCIGIRLDDGAGHVMAMSWRRFDDGCVCPGRRAGVRHHHELCRRPRHAEHGWAERCPGRRRRGRTCRRASAFFGLSGALALSFLWVVRLLVHPRPANHLLLAAGGRPSRDLAVLPPRPVLVEGAVAAGRGPRAVRGAGADGSRPVALAAVGLGRERSRRAARARAHVSAGDGRLLHHRGPGGGGAEPPGAHALGEPRHDAAGRGGGPPLQRLASPGAAAASPPGPFAGRAHLARCWGWPWR